MQVNQQFPSWQSPFVNKDKQTEAMILAPVWRQFLQSLWDRTGAGTGGGVTPPGGVIFWAGTSIPENFKLCDGSILNASEYQALAVALGASGPTFSLPNVPDYNGLKAIIRWQT